MQGISNCLSNVAPRLIGSKRNSNVQMLSNSLISSFQRKEVSRSHSSSSISEPDSTDIKSTKETTKRVKTPIGRLDELEEGKHPYQEKEPLPAWPDNTNPNTGEIGGPRGPEPTRYGDWERKGRVSDF